MDKKKQQVLVITGMHRSGTSLTASLLQKAGLPIGENLLGPARGNLRGHFEDIDFYHFHDNILNRLGKHYLTQTAFDIADLTESEIQQAQELVQNRNDKLVWGWKEPRTSLFLELWDQLLDDNIKFIFLYRHPAEVTLSLLARGHFEVIQNSFFALNSWNTYNQSILEFCNKHPDRFYLANISGITNDIKKFIGNINTKFGLRLKTKGLASLYQPNELNQTYVSAKTNDVLQKIIPESMYIYSELESLSHQRSIISRSEDGERYDEALAYVDSMASNLAEMHMLFDDQKDQLFSIILTLLDPKTMVSVKKSLAHLSRDTRASELESELNQLKSHLEEKERLIINHHDKHNHDVQNLQEQVMTAEQDLQNAQNQIGEKDVHISNLDATLATHQQSLQRLESSLAIKQDELNMAYKIIEKREQSTSDIDLKMNTYLEKVSSIENKLASEDQAVASLKDAIDTKTGRIQDLENALREAQTHLSKKDIDLTFLNKSIDHKENQLSELKNKLDHERSSFSNLQDQILKHSEVAEQYQQRLETLRFEIQDLKLELAKENHEKALLTKSLTEKENRIVILEEQIEAQRTEIITLKQSIFVEQNEANKVKKEADAKVSDLESLLYARDQHINKLKLDVKSNQVEIKALNKQVASERSEISALLQKVEMEQKQAAFLMEQVANQKGLVERLDQQVGFHKSQLELVEEKGSEKDKRLGQLEEKILNQKELEISLNQQVKSDTIQIQKLESRTQIQENKIGHLEQLIFEQLNLIKHLETANSQDNQQSAPSDPAYKDLEEKINAQLNHIQELEQNVHFERSDRLNLEELAQGKQQSIESLEQELKALRGQFQESVERNQYLENVLSNKDQKLQTLEPRVESQNGQIQSLKNHIHQKDMHISGLEYELDVLNGSISLKVGRKLYPIRALGERLIGTFNGKGQTISPLNENGLKNIENAGSMNGTIDNAFSQTKSSKTNIAFALPCGLTLGGVTTWSIEMSRLLANKNKSPWIIRHPDFGSSLNVEIAKSVSVVQTDCHPTPDAEMLERALSDYAEALPAVFIPNYDIGPYAACASLAKQNSSNIRVIGYCHTDDADAYYYGLLSYYEPIIHHYVAVSDEAAKKIAYLLPHRKDDISIMPYGVTVPDNLDRSYTENNQAPLKLMYAGRLVEHQKRVSDLSTLAQHLEDLGVNFHLNILGDGDDAENLRAKIRSLSPATQNKITMVGSVSPDLISDYWKASDLCVLVSDFEGTSISMLESMAMGCIPVVPEVSGTEAVIQYGENGFSYPVRDIEAMARAIKLIDMDRSLLPKMGKNAFKKILDQYSYDSYVDKFLQMTANTWEAADRQWPEDKEPIMSKNVREALETEIRSRLQDLD